MTRLAWITDIHYNFIDSAQMSRFHEEIMQRQPDGVLIGGDIGESDRLFGYLKQMSDELDCPLYFVLGNHDFYKGSIQGVRHAVSAWTRNHASLRYLTAEQPIRLSPTTMLIGHDCWGDGFHGDYAGSGYMVNDFLLIEEFLGLARHDIFRLAKGFGEEAAGTLRKRLLACLEECETVALLTHVPPFPELCFHNGSNALSERTPYYVCGAVGKMLREVMAGYPDKKLLCLSGHVHHRHEFAPLSNILAKTGHAVYRNPQIQEVVKVP